MSTSDSVALNTGDVGEEAGAENQVLAQETDTIDDRTCAEKKDEETSYQVPSNLNLTEHYNAVMSHHAKLQSLAGKDPKFKETLELGIKHCDDAIRMVDELRVFSDNEHFSEHSTTSLRYLTVFGYRADFEAMKYPEVDDPDRDEKRLGHLSSTLTLFKDFLERCATLGLCSRKKLQPYLELRPNTRPSRDVKVEQMKEQMRLEAALRTLDEQVRAMSLRGNTAGADDGDDVTREHTIKRLEVWVSKACGQLMTLTAERDMLAMMRGAHRDTAARPVADARSGIRGAPGGEQSDRRRPPRDPSNPPPKPFVITKDMVKVAGNGLLCRLLGDGIVCVCVGARALLAGCGTTVLCVGDVTLCVCGVGGRRCNALDKTSTAQTSPSSTVGTARSAPRPCRWRSMLTRRLPRPCSGQLHRHRTTLNKTQTQTTTTSPMLQPIEHGPWMKKWTTFVVETVTATTWASEFRGAVAYIRDPCRLPDGPAASSVVVQWTLFQGRIKLVT
eukprot:m.50235 g.50235  ORF g.50235 m.50235 type:complete len:501 (-) comp15367_c0_seq3:28-1530(-)